MHLELNIPTHHLHMDFTNYASLRGRQLRYTSLSTSCLPATSSRCPPSKVHSDRLEIIEKLYIKERITDSDMVHT